MLYNLLNSHSVVGKKLDLFHDFSLFILIFISFFVFSLLVIFWVNSWVFNNFVESKTTEFVWTCFPGIVLLFLLIPSIHGLYNLDYLRLVSVKMNAVVTGRQWYWSFKFLPSVGKNSLCSECGDYFKQANKSYFYFYSAVDGSNLSLPYWWKKLKKSYLQNDHYYVSPYGNFDGLQLPKKIARWMYGRHEILDNAYVWGVSPYSVIDRVEAWIEDPNIPGPKVLVVRPSDLIFRTDASDLKGIYHRSIWWGWYPLIRRPFFRFNFDSYLSSGSLGYLRNLDSDTPLILPTSKIVRFFFWSSDVIHSFAIPELSIKLDCVPGRLNSSYALISHVGKYFGQCSEICGANHSFMPISIEAYWVDAYMCFGNHYIYDHEFYWNYYSILRFTAFRLLGLLGFLAYKFFATFVSDVWNISYHETMPRYLCPGCVTIRNYIWWILTGESVTEEPRPKVPADPKKKGPGWPPF